MMLLLSGCSAGFCYAVTLRYVFAAAAVDSCAAAVSRAMLSVFRAAATMSWLLPGYTHMLSSRYAFRYRRARPLRAAAVQRHVHRQQHSACYSL